MSEQIKNELINISEKIEQMEKVSFEKGRTSAFEEIAEKMKISIEKVNDMEKKNTINEFKASYLAQGYSEELALDTAKASADGDVKKIMANQKKFLEEHDKKVVEKAMSEVRGPKGSDEKYKDMTLDKFKKLSPVERAEYSKEHPEEYQALYTK